MELQLRPISTRFHPLVGPVSRRRLSGLRGLSDGTCQVPQAGVAQVYPACPTTAPLTYNAPATYVAPTLIATPACASGPASSADSAECQAQIAAAQQQNFNLDNSANYNVDITNCNNNWAENDAAYTADGIVGPPNTCANSGVAISPSLNPRTAAISAECASTRGAATGVGSTGEYSAPSTWRRRGPRSASPGTSRTNALSKRGLNMGGKI